MNLIDGYVTKIIKPPIFKYNHWFLRVAYEDMGSGGTTELMFSTLEEALSVKPGYHFLH